MRGTTDPFRQLGESLAELYKANPQALAPVVEAEIAERVADGRLVDAAALQVGTFTLHPAGEVAALRDAIRRASELLEADDAAAALRALDSVTPARPADDEPDPDGGDSEVAEEGAKPVRGAAKKAPAKKAAAKKAAAKKAPAKKAAARKAAAKAPEPEPEPDAVAGDGRPAGLAKPTAEPQPCSACGEPVPAAQQQMSFARCGEILCRTDHNARAARTA